MNLLAAPLGEEIRITAIHAEPKTIKHLAALGVAVGSHITVFEAQWGASVIYVKESKLALDHATSKSIEVEVLEGAKHE